MHIQVEGDDEQAGELFQSVFDAFIVQLSTSGPEGTILFKRLVALDEYVLPAIHSPYSLLSPILPYIPHTLPIYPVYRI